MECEIGILEVRELISPFHPWNEKFSNKPSNERDVYAVLTFNGEEEI